MSDRLPRNVAPWIGLILGVGGVASYFLWIVPTVSPRLPQLRETALANLAVVLVGVLLSVIGVRRAFRRPPTHRGRLMAPALGAVTVAVAVFFSWYLFSFSSRLPAATASPAVGAVAPDFTLFDETGKAVQLASRRGRHVLLVFYRGFW